MRPKPSLSRRGVLLVVVICPALLGTEWKCAAVSNPTLASARIDLIEPDTPRTGDMVQVTGRGEGTPPLQFAWDFGDNSFAAGMQAAHVYLAPGNYTITFTVRDTHGNVDSDSSQIVVVARQSSSLLQVAQLSSAIAGEPIVLTVLLTPEDAASELAYVWTFSDGQTAIGPLATATFASAGAYGATVSATDDSGEMSFGQVTLQVAEVAGDGSDP